MRADNRAEFASTRPAAVVGAAQISYGELRQRAEALARGYDRTIAGRRDVVIAIDLRNSISFIESWAAAACLPNAVAVLDPAWPPAQLEAAIELLTPVLLIDASGPRLIAAAGEADDTGKPRWPHHLIGFTSGSTGLPKAYVRTRDSWARSTERSAPLLGASATTVTLAPGPLNAGIALYALVESLASGGTFVSLPHFDVAAIADASRRLDASRFVGVPTMYRRLLAAASSRETLRGIGTFVSAGAPMPAELTRVLAQAAPGAELIDYYGASELSFVTLRRQRLDASLSPRAGVGRPFPGVQIEIRDEDGNVLEDGQTGTIWVRSDIAAEGYVGAESSGFRRENDWCTVGDIGLTAAGELQLRGRAGEMVVTSGNNVYPSEVAAAIGSYPGLHGVEVIAVPDADAGARLVAVLGGVELARLDLTALDAHVRERLARYKLPKALLALAELPQTPNGKVDRGQLATLAATSATVPWPRANDAALEPPPTQVP